MGGLITPLIGLRYFRDREKNIVSSIESFGFEILDAVDEMIDSVW